MQLLGQMRHVYCMELTRWKAQRIANHIVNQCVPIPNSAAMMMLRQGVLTWRDNAGQLLLCQAYVPAPRLSSRVRIGQLVSPWTWTKGYMAFLWSFNLPSQVSIYLNDGHQASYKESYQIRDAWDCDVWDKSLWRSSYEAVEEDIDEVLKQPPREPRLAGVLLLPTRYGCIQGVSIRSYRRRA